MSEIDKAVSEAIRNGWNGAPIAALKSDRPLSEIHDYISQEWSRVDFVNGKFKVYSGRRLEFELRLEKN